MVFVFPLRIVLKCVVYKLNRTEVTTNHSQLCIAPVTGLILTNGQYVVLYDDDDKLYWCPSKTEMIHK
jgi:hypothetical protein